ncbi:MAG: hypothetical protein AAF065_14510 [Verrucomicrobiota bacterium]
MDLFHTTDIDGVSEINPSVEKMREVLELLDEPEIEDEEHPDVSLVHDPTGWSLSVFPNGIVTFENLDDEDNTPRFMNGVSRTDVLKMWQELSRGKIERLLNQAWSR